MTTLTREKAIEILGNYAENSRTGNLIEDRISKLVNFSQKCGTDKIEISVNNNWSKPKSVSELKSYALLGGTTYSYMVWAVVK